MIADHERFKNILTGLQSIVLTMAILIGGIWTLVTFDALEEAEIAKAQSEKLARELAERRVLNIQMEASQIMLPDDPARYILATVRFENIGKDSEIFYWSENPVNVNKVSLNEESALSMARTPAVRIDLPGTTGLRISAGEVVKKNFLARVREPGLYFVEFEMAASASEQESAALEGVAGAITWDATTHVIIE